MSVDVVLGYSPTVSDSTATPTPSTLSPAFVALLDDAAIFPPGLVPLSDAVAAHEAHRRSPHADLVDAFVVTDEDLTDLDVVAGDDPLKVSVVIASGAGGIVPAASAASRAKHLGLGAIEVALRDRADLVSNVRRVMAGLDQALDLGLVDDEVAVFIELPSEPAHSGWLAAADEVAAAGMSLKFRTGGVESDMFPSAETLGGWITAALDRECTFKCTAGLHKAVRHRDPDTGFEHHGFLNVLLATRVSLDGGDSVAVLAETDPVALTALFQHHGHDALARARRWFTGFGSCSITEPLTDLDNLGLLTGETS